MSDATTWLKQHKSEAVIITGALVIGFILWGRTKGAANTSAANTANAANNPVQYLVPSTGAAGNPTNTTTSTTGNDNASQGQSTTSQQMPFLVPSSNWSAIPNLSSALGAGVPNPNTNPGFDTFHVGSSNLTVEQLATSIYPEATSPTQALAELQYYNPGLGNSPAEANNVLSNNFITVPTQPGENLLASQAA